MQIRMCTSRAYDFGNEVLGFVDTLSSKWKGSRDKDRIASEADACIKAIETVCWLYSGLYLNYEILTDKLDD